MTELRAAQIEQAAKELLFYRGALWNDADSMTKERARIFVSAVLAPILQLPWDDPNAEEFEMASRSLQFINTPLADQFSAQILVNFVRRRNAAQQPKPTREEMLHSLFRRNRVQIDNGRTPIDSVIESIVDIFDRK